MSVSVFNPLYFGNTNAWTYPKYKINVYISKDTKYSEFMIDNKKNGYCFGLNMKTNFKTFEGNYINDLKNGFCRWYYENGMVSLEAMYKNDMRNGFFQNFYENGLLKSCGFFSNDKKVGVWYFYEVDGTVKQKFYM